MKAQRTAPFRRTHRAARLGSVALAVVVLIGMPAAAASASSQNGCSVKVSGSHGHFASVQAALDASPSGARLRVRGTCLGPIVVTKDATIAGEWGNSPTKTTLDAQQAGPVLSIDPGVTLVAARLRITGGYNHATLGGGIHNDGTLILRRSVVVDNISDRGGGLANFGDATILRSEFDHNGQRSGGNIHNEGTLVVKDSVLTRGQGRFGNNLANWGTATLVRTVVRDDDEGLLPFNGGGIENSGDLTLLGSTVTGNTSLFGGGIMNTGTATLIRSEVTDNSGLSGGGIINGPAFSPGTGAERLILIRSVVSGNTAQFGGGIYNKGKVEIDRHTRIGGNTAAAAGQGGGIFNDPGATVAGITNRTFTPPNVPDQCVGC